MLQIIGFLIVLLIIGFAVKYIPGESSIKRLVVGIVILIAVIVVVLWILSAFGLVHGIPFFGGLR